MRCLNLHFNPCFNGLSASTLEASEKGVEIPVLIEILTPLVKGITIQFHYPCGSIRRSTEELNRDSSCEEASTCDPDVAVPFRAGTRDEYTRGYIRWDRERCPEG